LNDITLIKVDKKVVKVKRSLFVYFNEGENSRNPALVEQPVTTILVK